MRRRHPLPKLWLMTDERQGESLWRALDRLPRGSGVVFRHYGLDKTERQTLFRKVRMVARRRGLMLILAGSPVEARVWGADGVHGRSPARTALLRTAPAHCIREIRAAERAGADLVFVSPVFPTRSHPDAAMLGKAGFSRLARLARVPVIALGGMTPARMEELRGSGAYGWAAIDYWSA